MVHGPNSMAHLVLQESVAFGSLRPGLRVHVKV